MRIRWLMMVFVLWMAVSLPGRAEQGIISDYTLMIYMNGSDLESDYMSATMDLLELLDGHIGENVRVVVETGGTALWHTDIYGLPQVSNQKNQRWLVTENEMRFLEEIPMANMGEADTLTAFIDFAKGSYPSDQYGLVLWNHGAGAVYGYGADEMFDYDTLTLKELQTALENQSTDRHQTFDFIGFDACLMASVETAAVVEPFARVLIGSEELEPVHGWNYEALADVLSSQPNPDPFQVGSAVLDGFVSQAESVDTRDALTVSVIDLDKIPTVLSAMDSLFTAVAQALESDSRIDSILKARLDSESYGEGSQASEIPDSDMVDLIDYAYQLSGDFQEDAWRLAAAVEEAVYYSVNSLYKPKAKGLSVYIPARDTRTMAEAGTAMQAIGMPMGQVSLINRINEIIGGADYELGIQGQVDPIDSQEEAIAFNTTVEGGDGHFHFNVGVDNLSKITEYKVLMGRIEESGDIQYLFTERVSEESIHDDGTILGVTLDKLVKVNGTITAMYFEDSIPGGAKYFIPITLNGEDADLIVIVNQDYPYGKILGARKLNDDNENIYNRNLIEIQPYDLVEAVFEYDDYSILSDTYSYDGWYIFGTIDPGKKMNLSWHPLPEGEYAYAFEFKDIYGALYQTDWIIYDHSLIGVTLEPESAHLEHLNGTEYGEGFIYPWDNGEAEQPSLWALPHVSTAYNNGLVTERSLLGFTIDITREGFCELVVNMYETITGEEIYAGATAPFSDTENPAVSKAYFLGVVDGYGQGIFAPDDKITREQLMTMFYRTLIRLDLDYEEDSHPSLLFDDRWQLSSWAQEGAAALVDYELINGVGNNLLAPKNNATVEQALKLVNGVYEFYISTH